MQAEGGLRDYHALSDELIDEPMSRSRETNGYAMIPISYSASTPSPSSCSPAGTNFIEHRVSKMDTLAGVAIKYGVEVADIRRMNGLVTDLQMFARKSLQIPLPGRHPPSPAMSNGSIQNGWKTPRHHSHNAVNSPQSLKLKPSPQRVSPAMCLLQGYYGLTHSTKSRPPEGTEMAVFKSGKTPLFEDDHTPFLASQQKLANGFSHTTNGDISKSIKEIDGSVKRRQKSDAESSLHTPEILLKEEGTVGVFSGRAGKGLALRPKLGSRADLEEGRQNSNSGDDFVLGNASVSVRKSSSASSLSEPENVSSIWPTSKWSLMPDGIARPILDGFQKPLTGWRNKAALD